MRKLILASFVVLLATGFAWAKGTGSSGGSHPASGSGSHAFNPADHPRGPDGKFVPKGGGTMTTGDPSGGDMTPPATRPSPGGDATPDASLPAPRPAVVPATQPAMTLEAALTGWRNAWAGYLKSQQELSAARAEIVRLQADLAAATAKAQR